MLKKIFASLLSFAIVATSLPVSAADLSTALANFGGTAASVNQPGRYQSGARDVLTAGGFDLRVPPQKNSAQLFSFTPPRIEAGCGGVSAFFGGFSFISGKEFEQLLKNIGSGAAMGFVAHLAMKALCPYCESVVQFLQRINQAAAQAAKNSCAWGKQMAQQFMTSTGTKGGFGFQAECSAIGPQAGKAKDAADADGSLCKTAFDAVAALEDWVGIESNKGDSAADKQKARDGAIAQVQLGNGMWRATGKMFPNSSVDTDLRVFRVWLMNLTGTTLVGTGDSVSCGGATPQNSVVGKEFPQIHCPGTGVGTVTADDVMHLMLCGATAPTAVRDGHANITRYCEENNVLGNAKAVSAGDRVARKVMVCDPARNADDGCGHILLVPVKDASINEVKLVNGTGLMYQVRDLLGEAVSRVINNKPIYDPSNAGDATGQRIVQLLQVAPYPLYQTINAAAVYPSAALDLIDTMSLLIGESLAYSYTDEYLRMAGRSETGAVIDETAVRRVNEALEGMRAKVRERKSLIVQNLTIQETLNANIRQINLAIQRQVMTTDVMNGNKFTATMGGSVIGSNNGKGTAPAGSN